MMTMIEFLQKENSEQLEYLATHEVRFVPLRLNSAPDFYQAKIGELPLGYAYPSERVVGEQATR